MFLIALMKRTLLMLNDLIDETELRLGKYDNLPDRTLVIRNRSTSHPNYYEQDWHNGKKDLYPLGKEDNKTVIAYKHQRYLRKKLKILKVNKRAAELFLSSFKDFTPEAIQEMLPLSYKGLPVNSYENDGHITLPSLYNHLPENIYNDSRFQKLLAWKSEDYKRNPAPLPDDPNIARDGTPMRSKGECLWYDDILFDGLPVRVDPELLIQGKSKQWHKLYPDFQFKCFDGSTILVEHFGSWDNDEYAERNKLKIQEYLDCGFVLGDNLVGTSDNAEHRTNELMILEALEKIKRRMFA